MKAMENWWVKLIVGGQTLEEIKIQRYIFLGNSLSSQLFVMAMMSFNHVLMKQITKSKENINHLMYMNYVNVF